MGKMLGIGLAQHIKMDYAQNLRKKPAKVKIGPSKCFSCHFLRSSRVLEFAILG